MIFAYIKQKDKGKTSSPNDVDQNISLDGLSDVDSDYSFFEP